MYFKYFIPSTGDVDLCLVPEVMIELEGENGCLPFLKQRVAEQGHAVIVVAEGLLLILLFLRFFFPFFPL